MTRPALVLLALLASAALAQSAGRDAGRRGVDPVAKYHEGARAFIGGDVGQAKAAVQAGLQADPDDQRLQALRDLIEQEQEEQDQRRGGQQDPDAENQDTEGERQDEGGEGGSGQQPAPPDDAGQEAEQDQTRTQEPPPGESDGGDPGDEGAGQSVGEGGPTPPGGAAVPEGQMSRAQAERILDAVGGDERLLLRELRRSSVRGRRSDKDW